MALLLRPSSLRTPVKLSAIFLQLPPSYRSFHASPRPQSVVSITHDIITALHSVTGLPWAYTLPLFALTLRTTLILPLSIYQRNVQRRQVSLVPLLQAWQKPLQDETIKEVGQLGPKVAHNTFLRKMRRKRIELYRRWNCQVWKNYLGLAQLPVFLITMETIRGMAGAHQGWWGMMTRSGNIEPGDAVLTSTGLVRETLIPLESTFATEGMLWFPNLLLPDPQLVLPFMLSGAILLNVFGNGTTHMSIWGKRLTRNLGVLALFIGPVMINVPSAMVLYWISSSMLAYGQAALLERLMPIRKPITPCKPKRPLRTGLEISEEKL